MTTSNIPDGVSFQELQNLADSAKDPQETNVPTFGEQELTRDQILDAVTKIYDDSMEVCNDPMLHKLLIMKCLSNFIGWHTEVGATELKGDENVAVHWLRDAGKFQAMMGIITDINVGQDDFITPMDD